MTTRTERKIKTKGKAKSEMLWDMRFSANLWEFGSDPLINFKFFDL